MLNIYRSRFSKRIRCVQHLARQTRCRDLVNFFTNWKLNETYEQFAQSTSDPDYGREITPVNQLWLEEWQRVANMTFICGQVIYPRG